VVVECHILLEAEPIGDAHERLEVVRQAEWLGHALQLCDFLLTAALVVSEGYVFDRAICLQLLDDRLR